MAASDIQLPTWLRERREMYFGQPRRTFKKTNKDRSTFTAPIETDCVKSRRQDLVPTQ